MLMRQKIPLAGTASTLSFGSRSLAVVVLWLMAAVVFWPVLGQAGIIRDAEIEAGFQRLVTPIAKAAGFPEGVIQIRIIQDNDYNAFVASGQTIYVTSRLIEDAWDVREFLGVMAHEVGHIREGHVPRDAETQKQVSQATALATIAAIAAAAGGQTDAATGVLIGSFDSANRQYLGRRRQAESIADETAMVLLEKTGMSAAGLRDLMKRFSGQRVLPESRQDAYYRTHPFAHERLQFIQDHVRTSHVGEARASASIENDYIRLRAKLIAWTAPPVRHFVEDKTVPSQNVLDFARAITDYRNGELLKALKRLDALVAKAPDDAYFHEFRGDVLFGLARAEDAANAYERALALAPGAPLIELSLGRALIAAGKKRQVERAVKVLGKARLREPKWAFVRRQYAVALGRAGRIAEADLALAEEAILLDDNERAVELARHALGMEDIDSSVRNRLEDIVFRYGK